MNTVSLNGRAHDTKLSKAKEVLLSGTLHATYSHATYRTEDGESFYKFRFVENADGKFDIDILNQPSYQGKDESYLVTHLMPSDRDCKKISIADGFEPSSLEKAQNLAITWAELTNTYIKTGITIGEQLKAIRKSR